MKISKTLQNLDYVTEAENISGKKLSDEEFGSVK